MYTGSLHGVNIPEVGLVTAVIISNLIMLLKLTVIYAFGGIYYAAEVGETPPTSMANVKIQAYQHHVSLSDFQGWRGEDAHASILRSVHQSDS